MRSSESASRSFCRHRPRGSARAGPYARAVITLLAALSMTGCTPTFDVSGTAAFKRSFDDISRRLDAREQEALRSAICYLAANGDYGAAHAAQVGGVGKSVKTTLFAATDIAGAIVAELGFQDIGGRTAAQAIDAAQSQSMKYFHRAPPPVEEQIAELKQAVRRDTAAEIAARQREIGPAAARLKSQFLLLASVIRTRFASYHAESGKGVLMFDVDNIGPMTIRAVRLDVTFQGRDAAEHVHRIFGPLPLEHDLGPGETQHLRIAAARDRADAAEAAPDPVDVADVAVTVTNARVSDGTWIVTVDTAKLDQELKAVADLEAAEARALDNLDEMAALLR